MGDRKPYAICGIISIACFILHVVSLSTPNWVQCIAIRPENGTDGCQRTGIEIPQAPQERYTGLIEFGLIYGYKQYNYGYGTRDRESFLVFKEHKDVYNTLFVILCLVFMGLSLILTLVASALGFINAKGVPVEDINGGAGVFAWNILGFVFSVTSMSLYVAVFNNEISKNALNSADTDDDFCMYSASFSYSFWIFVTAICLFVVNIVILVIIYLIENPLECIKQFRKDREAQKEIEIRDQNKYELKKASEF